MGNNDIGMLLVQLGADLNLIDYKGRTPAGLAEDKENFNFADILEKLGARKTKGYESIPAEGINNSSFRNVEKINEELYKDLEKADKTYKKLYKKNNI